MTAQKEKLAYWEQFRHAIMHEDNLVNHRLTWLLTIEGFLIGGFFVLQNSILSKHLAALEIVGIEFLLVLILLGAAAICYISYLMISCAYEQTRNIRELWFNKYKEERREEQPVPGTWRPCDPVSSLTIHDLPTIMGHFRYPRWFTTKSIPLILLLINIILVLSCVAIGWHAIRTDSVEQQGTPIKLEISMPGFTAKLSVKGDSALADSERELKALIRQRLRSILQSGEGPREKQP
ncbi:MAG: hypothetical protein AB1733_12350 [Thermodesulfobacteriota bacterium]